MKTDPHERLKAWLRRYQELQTDADRLHDRAVELRSRAESAKTSTLDGMPRTQSFDGDRTGALLAQLEEIEGEAKEAQEAATTARRELEAAIRQITGHGGQTGGKCCGCAMWIAYGGQTPPNGSSEMTPHFGTSRSFLFDGSSSYIVRRWKNCQKLSRSKRDRKNKVMGDMVK